MATSCGGYSNDQNSNLNPIEYFNFSNINSINIPSASIKLTHDLEHLINTYQSRIKISNPDRFHREVLETARELGYSEQDISQLEPDELIKVSVDIVCNRLDYYDVDTDPDFIAEHGKFLPIDEYFYLEKGDCDKYKNLTITTFNFLKSINTDPKTRNVYLTEDIGGNVQLHAWNSVIVLSSDNVYVTHIDPTFYDHSDKLEADSWHVNLDYFEFKFLYSLRRYNQSIQLIDELLDQETDSEKRSELLSNKAINLELLGDHLEAAQTYEKAAYLTDSDTCKSLWLSYSSNEYYEEGLDSKVIEIAEYAIDNSLTWRLPSILATAINSSKRMNNPDLEKEFLTILLTEYPNSEYIQQFK